jgi:peptidoglycan hydrolase FlgJ
MSTTQIQGTALYTDPAGLGSLKQAARAESPQALREAARQFESLFTQMMLRAMREASFGDSMAGSEATDFYQDMHDSQLALELSKGRGLGLAEMLVQQLTRAGSDSGTVDRGQGTGAGLQTTVADTLSRATDHKLQSTSSWPPASREDFIRQLQPHAERAGRALGVDPETLLAHAALETGWGRKVPTRADGACSFNLFGIKAGNRWPGATVGVNTLEFADGMATRRVERFRAYASPEDCFKDYATLIGNSDRYAAARGAGNDAAAFAKALHQGGYATDPDYARKLAAVADSLKSLLKNAARVPLTVAAGEE